MSTTQAIPSLPSDFGRITATFRDNLFDDIRENRLILPSIPDVAMRIRQAINDPNSDTQSLVHILNTDPSIAARILKIANSAIYSRGQHIEDLGNAINRLGLNLVQTLVTNLTILQLIGSSKGTKQDILQKLFEHSIDVAAMGYAIAKSYTRIQPEQMILAGIVHDIGYLPILQKLCTTPGMEAQKLHLESLLCHLHAEVGAYILEQWGFGQELVLATREHENIYRKSNSDADMLDILIVADLNIRHSQKLHTPALEPENVSAYQRLGIDYDQDLLEITEIDLHFRQMKNTLSAGG